MNWYKTAKKKYKDYHKLDTQLLCCGYPSNRRKNPYKPNKKKKTKKASKKRTFEEYYKEEIKYLPPKYKEAFKKG